MNESSPITRPHLQQPIQQGFGIIPSPGDQFWMEYSELWNQASVRSPFQAPELLRYLSGLSAANTFAAVFKEKDQLTASVLFLKNGNKVSFLSDKKTDSNFFIFHHTCAEGHYRQFFNSLFAEIRKRKWNMVLNHIPDWASYNEVMETCGRNSGMHWLRVPYSVCPVMEAGTKTAAELAWQNQEIRRRVNRFRKMNARFEILENDDDLESWVNDFTEAHILRWQHTKTPSAYRDPDRRRFLFECMKAWAAHDLLVRSAVVMNNKRIGFLLGLKEDRKMIHHSTTFHPDYSKYSPGIAVLWIMAEWMTLHQITVFDFGDGNESYKYILAQRDQPVSRIFASPKSHLTFFLKSLVIRYIRNNHTLYRIYSDTFRKFFRH